MRETDPSPAGRCLATQAHAASPDVSWEAYTLSVSPPGRPYVLEVEYPSDVPQTLGLSIIETNAAGTLVPIGLDSGIDVSDEAAAAAAPHWERHRLVFWPRTSFAAAVDHQSSRAVARRVWQDPRAGRLGTIAPQRCGQGPAVRCLGHPVRRIAAGRRD